MFKYCVYVILQMNHMMETFKARLNEFVVSWTLLYIDH